MAIVISDIGDLWSDAMGSALFHDMPGGFSDRLRILGEPRMRRLIELSKAVRWTLKGTAAVGDRRDIPGDAAMKWMRPGGADGASASDIAVSYALSIGLLDGEIMYYPCARSPFRPALGRLYDRGFDWVVDALESFYDGIDATESADAIMSSSANVGLVCISGVASFALDAMESQSDDPVAFGREWALAMNRVLSMDIDEFDAYVFPTLPAMTRWRRALGATGALVPRCVSTTDAVFDFVPFPHAVPDASDDGDMSEVVGRTRLRADCIERISGILECSRNPRDWSAVADWMESEDWWTGMIRDESSIRIPSLDHAVIRRFMSETPERALALLDVLDVLLCAWSGREPMDETLTDTFIVGVLKAVDFTDLRNGLKPITEMLAKGLPVDMAAEALLAGMPDAARAIRNGRERDLIA